MGSRHGEFVRKCNLCEELLKSKLNHLYELLSRKAMWEEFPSKFSYAEIPISKSNCTEQQLKQDAKEAIRKVYVDVCKEYYTDGSVDNSIPAIRTGVY